MVLGGTQHARRPPPVRLLTLDEAATLAGCDHKTIYRLAELGQIDPLQRDGKGRVYYSEAQLRKAIFNCYHLGPAA